MKSPLNIIFKKNDSKNIELQWLPSEKTVLFWGPFFECPNARWDHPNLLFFWTALQKTHTCTESAITGSIVLLVSVKAYSSSHHIIEKLFNGIFFAGCCMRDRTKKIVEITRFSAMVTESRIYRNSMTFTHYTPNQEKPCKQSNVGKWNEIPFGFWIWLTRVVYDVNVLQCSLSIAEKFWTG